METILIIVIIVFIVIYLVAQSSPKETTREKYGDAVGQIARAAGSTIAEIANNIAEPASKKEIRLAMEALASKNGYIYRYDDYSNKERIEKLFDVDESFKKSLDKLGLSEERWMKIGKHLFYVGIIKRLSRDHFDYSKKNEKYIREHIIKEWLNDPHLKDDCYILKEALAYFHITESNWILYGDTVIDMYNINDNDDFREYGIITQIKPMANNKHLL